MDFASSPTHPDSRALRSTRTAQHTERVSQHTHIRTNTITSSTRESAIPRPTTTTIRPEITMMLLIPSLPVPLPGILEPQRIAIDGSDLDVQRAR